MRLFSFRGRYRVLHATTFAFFLSFVVWFNFAPFVNAIGADLGLTKAELATIGICNLALTVPARLFVGMLLDRFGPRRLYAGLLIFAAVPNTVFALAHSFPVLVGARLAVGLVGAGFVVGIRMVSGWFEDDEMGTAEGIYGGWGNFGSAAAALSLPALATAIVGGPGAWRWGVGISGAVAAIYGFVYLFLVTDAPGALSPVRSRRSGALQVTSRKATVGLALMQVPAVAVLAMVAVRVERTGVIDRTGVHIVWGLLVILGAILIGTVLRANRTALRNGHPPAEHYAFAPVVILALAYFVTFGAELAVISLLPTFFADTFGLTVAAAGAAGSAFAFTNLVTRPGGGILSDRLPHRRRTLAALLIGTAVTFIMMTALSEAWPVVAGIALVALASVFVQGGNGAVFAMVPLIRRQSGGPIAGIAGSYGNIGGIAFSLLLFFTADAAHPAGDTRLLFAAIAACAAVAAVLCRWLPDLETEVAKVTVEAELITIEAAEERIV